MALASYSFNGHARDVPAAVSTLVGAGYTIKHISGGDDRKHIWVFVIDSGVAPIADKLLMESGDYLLLETGDKILLD